MEAEESTGGVDNRWAAERGREGWVGLSAAAEEADDGGGRMCIVLWRISALTVVATVSSATPRRTLWCP